MLTSRIIPCLDIRDGRVVKGVRFQGLRDAGDPVECARNYEAQGADELVVLDVSATPEGRKTAAKTIEAIRAELSIPLTVGGGVRSVSDARRLLDAGADKVSTNTAAVESPGLIDQLSGLFGRQCTVLAVDAARNNGGFWEVVTRSGKNRTGLNVEDWISEAVQRGAGEILLTSWDQDGTRQGYDLELLKRASERVRVPIIASGGANSPEDMVDALKAGANAVLAASIFHDQDMKVSDVKRALKEAGVEVRIC